MAKPKVGADYSDVYIHCRSLGHSWQIAAASVESVNLYRLTLRCGTCGTLRVDSLQRRTGGLLHRSYEHPDDYLGPKGLNRIAYKVELLRRITTS
jgi:hypothetical protein